MALIKGEEAFNYEFNFKNILNLQRLSNFETQQLYHNKIISYDKFNTENHEIYIHNEESNCLEHEDQQDPYKIFKDKISSIIK